MENKIAQLKAESLAAKDRSLTGAKLDLAVQLQADNDRLTNDPSFAKPLRVACFTIESGEEKGNMSVVWDDGNRRNRQTSETKEAAADGDDGLGNSTAGNDQHSQHSFQE